MKKPQLLALLREMVNEGVMDNLTTQLSRLIVNHLKRFSQNSNGEIPTFKGEVGDLILKVEFERRPIGPLHHAGGAYNYAIRELRIKILVPEQFNETQLGAFIPELKDVLRHELEHYRQDQRSGYLEPSAGVHYTHPGQTPSGSSSELGSNPFSSVEAARSYFLKPHEVEAFVMGLYKRAKTSKEPVLDLIKQRSMDIAKGLQKHGQVPRIEALRVGEEIFQVWSKYVEKRLPGVKPSIGGLY